MKETQRIKKLFEDAFNGQPWIDVSLMPVLQNLTASQATKKVLPQWNTIWEIVNHIISWRQTVLKRVEGKVIKTPSHNYFIEIMDTSSNAWEETLKNLEASQEQWIQFLKAFEEEDLENIYPGNGHSNYEHIQGIIQHDIYHLGQIVLLAKAV